MASGTGSSLSRSSKAYLVIIALLVILLGVMYVWKLIDDHNTGSQLEQQKSRLAQRAQQQLTEQGANLLKFSVMSLAWAVRSDMMAGNLPQINNYFNELVRLPQIRQITLVRADGLIVLSTNKKLQGQPGGSHFPATLLRQDHVSVGPDGSGGLQAVSPVFGLNRRLGVLIIAYGPEAAQAPAPQP